MYKVCIFVTLRLNLGGHISPNDLYLVTRPQQDWMKQVVFLIEQGVEWVQIRDKSISDAGLISQVQELQQLLVQRSLHCTLLVNDRIAVAKKTGVGLHLGQSDLDPLLARAYLGDTVPIGWTIHDQVELISPEYEKVIDYVGVGPIFSTTTKTDTKPMIGVQRLEDVVEALDLPVVAIGGISSENISKVRASKPWRIAMCSALMDATNLQMFF